MELGCKDPPENPEWALSVHRGARECRARQETPVQAVTSDQQVFLVCREIPDCQAVLDLQDQLGHRVLLEIVEPRVRQDR